MTERPRRSRRSFIGTLAKVGAAAGVGDIAPAAIQRALATPATRSTGTLRDVEHIVILTQENRSFDHYFGTLAGVRGFADPFPIPRPDAPGLQRKSVWWQTGLTSTSEQPAIVPFRLDTTANFAYTRVDGTPHGWKDAQQAWNHGNMHAWAAVKSDHALAYFGKDDIPFQWALANAFTLCDAYHCSMQAGTNPNRLFVWTGTNDPTGAGHGPALYNDYEWFDADPGQHGGYAWTTYPERLENAGISWQVYENMADNYTDNPLAGFANFRDAWFQRPGYALALRERGISTRDLDALAADVLEDRLPQVSWIVATAEGSEHPGPSSPAQGAAYISRVLDALTANPEVWSRTVLFINFDENDGYFDHMPPPAPPSYRSWDKDTGRGVLAGASTVDLRGEYHEHLLSYHAGDVDRALLQRPYGLGPRVPLYVISPWSKGGWVNSQVFDHTSIIRFIEARFGVVEPNISPWRRAVCGDLTSAFDFSRPDGRVSPLPETQERAARARALVEHTTPNTPTHMHLPAQETGVRPSRALPYQLQIVSHVTTAGATLTLANLGTAAAVLHVYDRLRLNDIPHRYTVEAGKSLEAFLPAGDAETYDLWILGPNGFHRHCCGRYGLDGARGPRPEVQVMTTPTGQMLNLVLHNTGNVDAEFRVAALRYAYTEPTRHLVAAQSSLAVAAPLPGFPWYDFAVTVVGMDDFGRRVAGRIETGADSCSDPAMGGPAIGDWFDFAVR